MDLKSALDQDIKQAMRAKNKHQVTTLRLVMAAIKQVEIDQRKTLDDDAVIKILSQLVKQRNDSITHYIHGKRTDLANKERAEIKLIETYLPKPIDENQIDELIEKAITDTQSQSMKDLGQVMGYIKKTLRGPADMRHISTKVKTRLSG